MTLLRAADSVTAGNLPPGMDAYAAYTDGIYANAAQVAARFPGKPVLTITVTGADLGARCCDCERYDATPADAAAWAKAKIGQGHPDKPVIYCSQSAIPDVLAALTAAGVARSQILLWTAHYDPRYGSHICSPGACRAAATADGTQWIDRGDVYDESILQPYFFAAPKPAPVPQEDNPMKDCYLREDSEGHVYFVNFSAPSKLYITSAQLINEWTFLLTAAGYPQNAVISVAPDDLLASLPTLVGSGLQK